MPVINRISKPEHSVRLTTAMLGFVLLASTAWTPMSRAAEFPAVIPLSSLDGGNGFRLDGVGSYDFGGSSVAGAGDVNGDGFADVIVGAPGADPDGKEGAGSSYVVFGKATGFLSTFELSALDGANGFRLDGSSDSDYSGAPVAGAGDVNGDGFADLIIGAWRADPSGRTEAGSSYVVFGKASGFAPTINFSTLDGTNGFRLEGVSISDWSGFSVAGAGDVNGDGFADLIIGAPRAASTGGRGSSYVVFGKASGFPSAVSLSTLNGTNGFRLFGVTVGDRSGISVAGAGDVNGDGFDDVIIGASDASPAGRQSAGSSFVVFGKSSGFSAPIDLSALDGSNGFRMNGIASYDHSGISVDSAGDVNGDGFADLIVGAFFAKPAGVFSAGQSFVVFGKASGFSSKINLADLNGTNGFRLDGFDYGGRSGMSVAGGGDINGDGFADLIIGAYQADTTAGFNSGQSYLVFGKASGFASTIALSTLDGGNGFRLDGVSAYDYSGRLVASAGDFNGDGFSDVIVGADGAKPHGDFSGSSYLIFGRQPDTARTRVGSAAGQYISGGPFADTLKGLGGGDAIEGRSGSDEVYGGAGGDTASYLHAAGRVTASIANPAVNSGEAAGDSYHSIENLIGSRFDDRLTGNSLANRLTGAPGADLLTGGTGDDIFAYTRLDDSPVGAGRDKIADFDAGTAASRVDRIDLSAIDAKTGPGNQAFTFIGTAPFSNVKGQLRIRQVGTTAIIAGDVNGDSVADLQISLLNFTSLNNLTSIDFIR